MTKPMKPGQQVIVALRRMIASGELPDGARIAEIPTAARLGVSRMPVRTALRALEQEGLVMRLGARGYAARGPSLRQIEDAVEVRGALEGLAARRCALRVDHSLVAMRLARHIETGAPIFAAPAQGGTYLECFYRYNLAFHAALLEECGNAAIAASLARNNHLPFASASALALPVHEAALVRAKLLAAHQEHVAVVEAIGKGAADEAERLMRGHARQALDLAEGDLPAKAAGLARLAVRPSTATA